MFKYLIGYIRMEISADDIAVFISKCKRNNIPLYNIKEKNGNYHVDVKGKAYRQALSIAKECGVCVKLNGRIGLFMRLVLYKSRKAFVFIICTLILYYGINYMYISDICINGNEIFTDNQIYNCLERCGIYKGRLKFGIDPVVFQNEFIKKFSGVSWIWIKIDGTKAIIDLKERVAKPEIYNYNDYGNVVASKDGVIKSAVASQGIVSVSEGMYVKKRDILINGVYGDNENSPAGFVNAEGKVLAVTKYSLEDEFSCSYIKYTPIKNKNAVSLKILNTRLWDNIPCNDSVVILKENDYNIKFFGKKYLPLAFTKAKYCEIIREEYTLSYTQSLELAYKELCQRINHMLPEAAVVNNITKTSGELVNGRFTASVCYECVEDIAVKLPIEVITE